MTEELNPSSSGELNLLGQVRVRTSSGAKFYRCDLHVHTPASNDYEDRSVTNEQIIDECVNKNLDIIAITDHNIVGDIENLRKIGKKRGIFVIPGIEISVGEFGIHIIALLDEVGYENKFNALLSRLGIFHPFRGKREALSNTSIMQALDEIREFNGLIIAAHTDSTNGLTEDLRGEGRTAIIKSRKIDALEITKMETSIRFDGSDPVYQVKIPCIQSSDSHSLSELGRKITRMKMETPSFEGLRQAFIDSESRIRFEEEIDTIVPKIIELEIQGGFLNGLQIKFNDNLNCIIGGRGAGKSTLIELIRFLLDSPPTTERILKRHHEMIEKLLGNGLVRGIIDTGTNQYEIKRQLGEDLKIYKDGVLIENLILEELFPIVAYSEMEIEESARIYESQLELIDKFVEDSEELKRLEQLAIDALNVNKINIKEIEDNIYNSEEQLAELPTVKAKISSFEKHNFESRLEISNLCIKEKTLIDSITEIYENIILYHNLDDKYEYLVQMMDGLDIDDFNKLPNYKKLNKVKIRLERVTRISKNRMNKLINYIDENFDSFNEIKEELIKDHEEKKAEILKIVKEFDTSENEAAALYMNLKGKEAKLSQLETSIIIFRSQLEEKTKNRGKLIADLENKREELFDSRKKQAIELSDLLGELINIDLEKNAQKENYMAYLNKHLTGTRTYKTEKERIIDNFNQFELYDIINNNNRKEFIEITEISEERTDKIFNQSSLINNLYDLQSLSIPDKPIIQLKVGDIYKPISELSLGQRCTTILSILMLKIEIPLILDTPEQGLDNIFIFDTVVKNLRKIKEKRQIIIATHNANMPVSGDSELILYLESDGKRGAVSSRGSIDNADIKIIVQDVLEGGKEAFELRKRKYEG